MRAEAHSDVARCKAARTPPIAPDPFTPEWPLA